VLKVLAVPEVAIRAGTAKRAFEQRGVRLRRPLARKKVEGWARAARRSIEVEDIRKDGIADVVERGFAIFKELFIRSFEIPEQNRRQ
jgi:NOL1/NOP2/fmu family ribosome biogenesis protein